MVPQVQVVVFIKMFVPPGFLNKKLTGIEKERQETIKQNLIQLEAAGIKPDAMKAMAMALYGSKNKGNDKSTKERNNRQGYGSDDEEFLPPEGEENLSSCSGDNECSRPQAKKVIFT